MKKMLLLWILLLVAGCLFGQSKPDTSLTAYLNKKYIKLSDTSHLPYVIMPYYADIMVYLSGQNTYLKESYVWIKYLHNDTTKLTIPLISLNEIVYYKNLDQKNEWYRNHPDTIIIKGKKQAAFQVDIGHTGDGGELTIDKTTHKIVYLRGQ